MQISIADLRTELKLSLDGFAKVLGLTSRSRASEIERGAPVSLPVALKLEGISGGRIDAASLNADVAAARAKFAGADTRTHDASSAVDDEPADELVVITCSVCDQRDTEIQRRGCQFVDCPHSDVVGERLGSGTERLAA